ncbi:Integrin alpha N-terminal domain superfamily protein [Pseudohyphozyma bogoriensis]|nr:Integrin alpha N-terminal domain superfamily protein [Pseudohyphozyma bogoriensis]
MRLAAVASFALCLALSNSLVSAWQLKLGEQRYAGQEHLVDAGALGLPSTGLVAAFGDYNADQLLDLFFLSSDQRSLSVYVWDREAYSWVEKVESRIRTKSDFIIVNVVPGDYDYDGKLDVLLMGEKNPGGWWGSDDTLEMAVYLQKTDGTFEQHDVGSSSLAHPMAFDATGDMRPDLLGFTYEGSKGKTLVPKLWKNVWSTSNSTTVFDIVDPPIDFGSATCTFPTPHSNAYIDLDGDCLADLFLMCEGSSPEQPTYQMWTNDKAGGFKLAKSGALPKGTKSVGFADMDRDGTIDLVITTCDDDACSISIAYNSQMPLCTNSKTQIEECRDPEALCVADKNFAFNFSEDDSNPDFTTIPITALFPSNTLVTESTSFRGTLPTPPAIGDYNIDGYPDLLVVVSHSGKKTANILESRPCDKSAHWVDMDDDGSLDIMVQRSGSGGSSRHVVFIKNNYFHDAFFLKALVLNGACQNWCEPKAQGELRYRPYGVSYSGASYKFTVLDPTGSRKATQVGQLPQTSYLSLGTPYSYFGLGRTNNYVENLFIGSTRDQPEHYINVEGLIPNSQVVIDPYQPDGRFDPSTWSRELYLHPGDWIPFRRKSEIKREGSVRKASISSPSLISSPPLPPSIVLPQPSDFRTSLILYRMQSMYEVPGLGSPPLPSPSGANHLKHDWTARSSAIDEEGSEVVGIDDDRSEVVGIDRDETTSYASQGSSYGYDWDTSGRPPSSSQSSGVPFPYSFNYEQSSPNPSSSTSDFSSPSLGPASPSLGFKRGGNSMFGGRVATMKQLKMSRSGSSTSIKSQASGGSRRARASPKEAQEGDEDDARAEAGSAEGGTSAESHSTGGKGKERAISPEEEAAILNDPRWTWRNSEASLPSLPYVDAVESTPVLHDRPPTPPPTSAHHRKAFQQDLMDSAGPVPQLPPLDSPILTAASPTFLSVDSALAAEAELKQPDTGTTAGGLQLPKSPNRASFISNVSNRSSGYAGSVFDLYGGDEEEEQTGQPRDSIVSESVPEEGEAVDPVFQSVPEEGEGVDLVWKAIDDLKAIRLSEDSDTIDSDTHRFSFDSRPSSDNGERSTQPLNFNSTQPLNLTSTSSSPFLLNHLRPFSTQPSQRYPSVYIRDETRLLEVAREHNGIAEEEDGRFLLRSPSMPALPEDKRGVRLTLPLTPY